MNPLQPQKSEYWLFPKIADWTAFARRVALVCHFILLSISKKIPNLHVISVDEKTGIQAISRKTGRAPLSKGGHMRKEYEYDRHGTTTLMAAVHVENGKAFSIHLGPTRTEDDYCAFIQQTVYQLPQMDKIIILSDQLNTHMSESLVRWIAEQEEYDEDLGEKGKSGILKSMESRKVFLEKTHHRIQFLFTPKHCSWLNPIENWFAKLQRHVVTNGNYSSVNELESKIRDYVKYHNRCLAKPLNWKFKGFEKDRKLHNFSG